MTATTATDSYRAARDLLLDLREDPDRAHARVRLARRRATASTGPSTGSTPIARGNDKPALVIVEEDGTRDRAHASTRWPAASDQVAAWLAGHGVAARRRGDRDARQPGRAVGDDARDHEARRGDHADHHRGRARRPRRPDRRAAGRGSWSATPSTPPSSTTVPGRLHRCSADGERACTTRTPLDVPPAAAPGHRARRPAAALLHLRHDVAAQARRAHPGVLPGRPPRRRCTGSACAPATCT